MEPKTRFDEEDNMIMESTANMVEGWWLFEGALLLGAKKPFKELKAEVNDVQNIKIDSCEEASIPCYPQVKECFAWLKYSKKSVKVSSGKIKQERSKGVQIKRNKCGYLKE